jgi:hypothetical protein
VKRSREPDKGLRWGSAPRKAVAKEKEQDCETESMDSYGWSDLRRSLLVLGVLAVVAEAFATLMFRRQAE